MSDRQRTAIVTGAAGGIGRALVGGLLDAGIRVAASDRTAEGLAALAASARERGREAALLTIEADLARDDAVDRIVAAARGRFGTIDILVNNAGVGQATIRSDNRQNPIKFWEITPEQWRLFVAVHTNAPMALSRAVVHDMMRQRWGRIVNVTTSLGTMIRAGSPTYGPSKAALEAFSAIMAKDLDGTGVTVNVLVPGGATNTGMIPAEAPYAREDMIQPEVMAPPLVWLVSDAAARRDRPPLPGGALGPGAAARAGRGESRRPGRVDQHRDDADRAAAPELTPAGSVTPAATGAPRRGRSR